MDSCVFLILFASFSLVIAKSSNSKCAHFNFPNVSTNTLTAEEGSVMDVSFTLNSSCDHDPLSHSTVEVRKKFGGHEIVCYFEHPVGRCEKKYDQPYCKCPSGTGNYHRLVYPVERFDAGVWRWSAPDSDEIEDASVTLVVTYPSNIEQFKFWNMKNPVNEPVSQNSSVTIFCSWDKGVPPVTSYLRLLGRRGNELLKTNSSGQVAHINYTLSNVQCGDAGVMICETGVEIIKENRTLLVECAPEISVLSENKMMISLGEDLHITLPVRSHSAHINKCRLRKIKEQAGSTSNYGNNFITHVCDRTVTLTGAPPDMTLQLNLTNVTSEMEGTWILGLANHVGESNFVFNIISVLADTTTAVPILATTLDSNSFEFAATPFGITLISVNCCIIVAIIVIVVKMRSRGRRSSSSKPRHSPERPLPHEPMVRLADLEVIMQTQQAQAELLGEPYSSHDYEEVKNSAPQAEGGASLAAAELSKKFPIEEDDTYLHPVPSALELTQNQDEPDSKEHYSLPSSRPAYRSDLKEIKCLVLKTK